MRRLVLALFFILLLPTAVRAADNPDWTTPLPPFRIADNLYYVGSRDLAIYLVTTPAGNILINAGLETSPPQIRASVEKLGFRWADTRILLNSQAHFDHVGGAAEVLRETHAKNFVMEYDAQLMEDGGTTDFARKSDGLQPYPPTQVDRILHDGDTVALGGITLIAHKTAGHTRGCTTWTMRVHLPGDPAHQLRNVVIVGGWAALSGYRLVATRTQAASYPGIAHDFEATFATLHGLPCDIFLGAHGVYFDLLPKLARMPQQGDKVWIDPTGYRRAVNDAEQTFEDELSKQKAQQSAASAR